MPFATFQHAFNERDHVGWFSLTARADADANQVENEIKRVLKERHSINPDDPEAIGSFNAAEQFAKFITSENEKWGKVIRAANIKPE